MSASEHPEGPEGREKSNQDQTTASTEKQVEEDATGGATTAGDGDLSEGEPSGEAGGIDECTSCGHSLDGIEAEYCPNCGHTIGEDLTAREIADGFFREFIDVEQGFLATLAALTRRPGRVLGSYMSGAYSQFMNPGRFLLASVVISFLSYRVLTWAGALQSFTDRYMRMYSTGVDNEVYAESLRRFYETIFQSQWIAMLSLLVLAASVALCYWRLFGRRVTSAGEALALGSLLVGHGKILESGLEVIYAVPTRLVTGQPATAIGFGELIVLTGYAGWATYQYFGPDWKAAVSGAFGMLWAYLEVTSVTGIIATGYFGWVAFQGEGAAPEEVLVRSALLGAAWSLPLVLHAAVETYYQL